VVLNRLAEFVVGEGALILLSGLISPQGVRDGLQGLPLGPV
jgi:hypothetical protein